MDLHDRFNDWLTAGAEGEPPRDLAMHAASCDACMRFAAAVDSIRAIAIDGSSMPPLWAVDGANSLRAMRVPGHTIAGLAIVVLGTSVAIGVSHLLRPPEPVSDLTLQTPGEGVLGSASSATPTPRLVSDTPSPSATGSSTPSPSPTATSPATAAPATAAPATAAPVQVPTPPRPPAEQPVPPATPAPTAPPTAAAPSPTTATTEPSPSEPATPTPAVTVSPTLLPSASPSASASP